MFEIEFRTKKSESAYVYQTLAPLRGGGIDICARELFCTKFNFEQLLFKAFFDAMRVFGVVEAQTESISPFLYIIIFQRWESFEPPPLRGKLDICAGRLFCTKLNFDQLLFETFFDAMRIFGASSPFPHHFDLICLYNSPNTLF